MKAKCKLNIVVSMVVSAAVGAGSYLFISQWQLHWSAVLVLLVLVLCVFVFLTPKSWWEERK